LPPAPVEMKDIQAAHDKGVQEAKKRGRPAAKPAEAAAVIPIPDIAEESTVTVTWGVERFSPINYSWFEVGPFQATTRVRPGESRVDAMKRVMSELSVFAEYERTQKAEAFKNAMGAGK